MTQAELDSVFPRLEPGQRCAVRNRFNGVWSRGFEVVSRLDHRTLCYTVRRLSDGWVLPEQFPETEVIPDAEALRQ